MKRTQVSSERCVYALTRAGIKAGHIENEVVGVNKAESRIELGPSASLTRTSWTSHTLKPGMVITVSGQPSRAEDSHRMCCASITRTGRSPDRRRWSRGGGAAAAAQMCSPAASVNPDGEVVRLQDVTEFEPETHGYVFHS